MCGFVGLITNDIVDNKDLKDIIRMNKLIKHRGPDHEGYYHSEYFVCGSSRLAIIDLNKRANQPMVDENKRYVLLFNGEIYNYEEVKNELKDMGYIFKTTSDTEVVLKSFIEWNVNCASKFIGMFAFVIFDLKNKETYMLRDQLGIKPLYFYSQKNKFYFASEIKPFLVISSLRPNYEKLLEYSIFGNIAGKQTLFKNTFQLLPGHFVRIDRNLRHTIHQYFDIKQFFYKKKQGYSLSELEELLNDSVLKHTKSDVGYGIQLSGGLDSSYVLSVTALYRAGLETFSIGLENHSNLDESKYQKLCAEKYQTIHHSYSFENKDFGKYLVKSIWAFDYPLHHPNIVPTYIVCMKAMQKGVKVLLSGDGGDEIFCGYKWYFKNKDFSDVQNDDLVYASSYNSPKTMINLFNKSKLNLDERKKIIENIEDSLSALLILDQTLYLQKWLQRQDRMGMASSVEIRVPYCNVKVFEYLNNIDMNDKTKSLQEPKYLLKKIAEKHLPYDLVWRKKIGFGIPLEDWFREKDGLYRFLKYLQDDIFKERGIYDISLTEKLINEHLHKKYNHGRILWTLLNIELWHRIFIDRFIDPFEVDFKI